MILGLRTVIYPVADLTRAKAWYAQVLGKAPYFDEVFCGGIRVASLADPDGNRIAIIENPHFDVSAVR